MENIVRYATVLHTILLSPCQPHLLRYTTTKTILERWVKWSYGILSHSHSPNEQRLFADIRVLGLAVECAAAYDIDTFAKEEGIEKIVECVLKARFVQSGERGMGRVEMENLFGEGRWLCLGFLLDYIQKVGLLRFSLSHVFRVSNGGLLIVEIYHRCRGFE